MNRDKLYKLEDVSKKISLPGEDIKILKGLSLEINRGESVAIVGASGSGKTTLLHILGALDRPTCGKVFFKGIDISIMDETERARFRNTHLGFVFQFHHLLAEFNVLENVAMPLIIRRVEREKAYIKAEEILSLIGMGSKITQMVNTLSGGERQLVALARSLVGGPEVLLADEPTGNLDYINSMKVGELFNKLNTEMGLTVIIVTHNMELANLMGRILRLKDGKIQ